MPRLLPCLSTAAACVALLGVAGLIVERSTHEPTTTTIVAAANAIPYECGGKHLAGADEEPEFYMTEEGTCYTPADRDNPCFVHDEQYLRPCPTSANGTRRLAEGTAMMHDDADPTTCRILQDGWGQFFGPCAPLRIMKDKQWTAIDTSGQWFRPNHPFANRFPRNHQNIATFANLRPLNFKRTDVKHRFCSPRMFELDKNHPFAVCYDENKDPFRSLWMWDEYTYDQRTGNQYLVARIDNRLQYCSPGLQNLIQCGLKSKDESKADVIKDHESIKYTDGTPVPVVKFNGRYCTSNADALQCNQDTEVPIVNPS